jgi:hypothetical protein
MMSLAMSMTNILDNSVDAFRAQGAILARRHNLEVTCEKLLECCWLGCW